MRMTKMDLKCVFNPEFGHEGERLVQPAKQKKRVIIVGGGMIGVETAEFLADQNRKVTVIEMLQLIASDVGITTRWGLVSRLRKKKAGLCRKRHSMRKEVYRFYVTLVSQGNTK